MLQYWNSHNFVTIRTSYFCCSIFFHVVLEQLIWFLDNATLVNDPDFISLLLNIFPQWPGCGYYAFFSETATLPSLWTTQETRTGMTNRSPINHKMRMEESLREGGWNFRHFAYLPHSPPPCTDFWELVFGGQNHVLCDGLPHQNIPLIFVQVNQTYIAEQNMHFTAKINCSSHRMCAWLPARS